MISSSAAPSFKRSPIPNAEVPADDAPDTRDYLYTLTGPIADGDLVARVDQYAAGTFSFTMDVTTTDGADTSTLSGLPFQFNVAPVAQQADISVSATSSSEADGSLAFAVDVASVDTDGSEFVSQISLSFALTGTIHTGTENDVALVIGGESYAVTSVSAGNYSVTVPGRSRGLRYAVWPVILAELFRWIGRGQRVRGNGRE